MNDINKYSDIINLTHHISKKHKQMSLYERSAQFAPFAALTGFEGVISETGRLTDSKIDIDEEMKEIINRKLQIVKDRIKNRAKVTITFFVPDLRKDGGSYKDITGIIKRIDDFKNIIIFEDGKKIEIANIVDIFSDELNIEK